ncbi:1-acyl-sn-glycerol-3-phosphate acyltransferase [Sulfurimonas sp. HSL3-7]|uniref:1-acyl-sn-glycerol-3-phosphate acyltransferase n=1 Tax=Sulfonitrofixus jiaomeiensis TaxID=3131938 RepID=UPI0031F770EE
MSEQESIRLSEIEKRVRQDADFVKEIAVQKIDGKHIAFIYPDFDLLKKQQIVNIEDQVKWYAVEIYNMHPIDKIRLDGYRILKEPISSAGESTKKKEEEPGTEVYRQLKTYLQGVTTQAISPSSHLELDLGLDSLDYVMLFTFVEKNFGVHLDEALFAERMVMQDLCDYIAENRQKSEKQHVAWSEIVHHPIDYALPYAPFVMLLYKVTLLPLFRLYFRLSVTGKENLPEAPCIIAPSHESMLDGFVVEASLPYGVLKKTFFLAFEVVFGRSFLGMLSSISQMIMIDINHDLKTAMQRTAEPLKRGANVVIFPEGARSRDGKLLPFKRYYAILSKELNVPVVPVMIDGTFEAMKAGELFPRPAKVRLQYLPPIYPDGLSYDEINERVKRAIAQALESSSQ